MHICNIPVSILFNFIFSTTFINLSYCFLVHLESLLKDFESSQEELFDSQIFGKKLGDVVSTNLVTKLNALPESTRLKVQQLVKTLANKSKQNLIAIVF